MLKRLYLYLLIMVCFFSNALCAQEPIRVLVLPFEIHASKDVEYFKEEILKLIKNHLRNDGATVLEQERELKISDEDDEDNLVNLRSLGIWHGADYVIHGSLSRMRKKISLDARMITSFQKSPPHIFFVEGESIQNLPGTIKKLANHFGRKLFKVERIKSVEVRGNVLIGNDAIEKHVKISSGDIYNLGNISKDMKSIYKMGFFNDIRVDSKDDPDGKKIIFQVNEKPTIHKIMVKGNKKFDDEHIKEFLDLKLGSFLDIVNVKNSIDRIEKFYKEKNHHNVHVSYKTSDLDRNQVNLIFFIMEGRKSLVKKIRFIGNSMYNDKTLLKRMKTSEKSRLCCCVLLPL